MFACGLHNYGILCTNCSLGKGSESFKLQSINNNCLVCSSLIEVGTSYVLINRADMFKSYKWNIPRNIRAFISTNFLAHQECESYSVRQVSVKTA